MAPIIREYHNDSGFRKMCRLYGGATMQQVRSGLESSTDPYGIDAIFFINRFLGGDFEGVLKV